MASKKGVESLFKKGNFERIAWPFLTLFACVFISGTAVEFMNPNPGLLLYVASRFVTTMIAELFSYITCWALVIRKNGSDKKIWINYVVWIVILCAGNISVLFGI